MIHFRLSLLSLFTGDELRKSFSKRDSISLPRHEAFLLIFLDGIYFSQHYIYASGTLHVCTFVSYMPYY